jgi:hypothetical protein
MKIGWPTVTEPGEIAILKSAVEVWQVAVRWIEPAKQTALTQANAIQKIYRLAPGCLGDGC